MTTQVSLLPVVESLGSDRSMMTVKAAPVNIVNSVGQAIASLATSLFADQTRNRQMMPLWLAHPVPSPTADTGRAQLTRSATTWAEHERERLARRRASVELAMSKRSGGLDVALERHRKRLLDNLVPAATAAAGRRVPRASSALRSTVMAMRASSDSVLVKESSTAETAPTGKADVDSIVTIIETLLLEPIDLTIVAGGGDDRRLHIFPFGDERLAQFSISSNMLSSEELAQIEYLAMSQDEWADPELYRQTSGGGERLRASYVGNDAFDVALDRVRLVDSLREMMLYAAADRLVVRHVVEAALVSTACRPPVMQAGYYESLLRMAHATRCAPVPVPMSPLERRSALTVAAARERSYRLHIRTIDARIYHAMLQQQLVGDEEAHRRAVETAFGSARLPM